MQETFLRLARSRAKLAKVDDLNAYIFAIARNEAARLASRDARRQRKQEPLGRWRVILLPAGRDGRPGDRRDLGRRVGI